MAHPIVPHFVGRKEERENWTIIFITHNVIGAALLHQARVYGIFVSHGEDEIDNISPHRIKMLRISLLQTRQTRIAFRLSSCNERKVRLTTRCGARHRRQLPER